VNRVVELGSPAYIAVFYLPYSSGGTSHTAQTFFLFGKTINPIFPIADTNAICRRPLSRALPTYYGYIADELGYRLAVKFEP